MKLKSTIIATSLLVASTFATAQVANQKSDKNQYGNNIVRFAPISLTDAGVGVGIGYERFLEPTQKVSFILPIDIIFAQYENGGFGNYDENVSYVYIQPGLRFYPANANRKATYSIGPNLFFAYGNGEGWRYNPNTGVSTYGEFNNTRFGIVATNYLDINITPKFNLGFSLGVGIRYSSKYNYVDSKSSNYNEGINAVAQFKFQMGYRF